MIKKDINKRALLGFFSKRELPCSSLAPSLRLLAFGLLLACSCPALDPAHPSLIAFSIISTLQLVLTWQEPPFMVLDLYLSSSIWFSKFCSLVWKGQQVYSLQKLLTTKIERALGALNVCLDASLQGVSVGSIAGWMVSWSVCWLSVFFLNVKNRQFSSWGNDIADCGSCTSCACKKKIWQTSRSMNNDNKRALLGIRKKELCLASAK